MKFLHTMVRVYDLEAALRFFCEGLGLREVRRRDSERGQFTLVFLETGHGDDKAQVELTYNWHQDEPYTTGRAFGHLAYEVDNIYEVCERFQRLDVTIARPPRDGRMAFIRSPDLISIELLQKGEPLEPVEPWISMENSGSW